MMRESVQSWTQDPWPLIENTGTIDPNLFDANAFLSADQVLQLQDLFGHDEHDFDREASLLYDEFTFAPETVNNASAMVDTIEPSDLINTNYVDNIINTIVTEVPMTKRRRSSSCSTSSSLSSHFSSSSSSEDEDADDFSSINNRRFSMSSSSSSDSEPEQEVITPFLHRRQMEEMILDKITNHLDPEKLPGILAIISKAHEDEVEEVEIDLAKLDRDQLERILSYVNACLIEKEGGAKVKLSEYIIQRKPAVQQQPAEERVDFVTKQQPPKSKNKRKNNRRKSIVEAGHTVSGTSTSRLSASHGPISMSALTELESKSKTSKNNKRKRRAKKNRKDDDVSVHMSTTNVNPFKDSIASTKPKRKSAIHKRRLLEEMLQPSNEDSDDEDEEGDNGSGIIVFGDEQMDMAVTHNETIVHQEQSSTVQQQEMPARMATVVETIDDDDEDDDELIDIMM